MSAPRHSTWTRRIAAWLIVCVAWAGMWPAYAAPSNGAAMDEICSVIMGVDATSAPAGKGAPMAAGHHDCSLCAAGSTAPGPARQQAPQTAGCYTGIAFQASPVWRAAVLPFWQARAPPSPLA